MEIKSRKPWRRKPARITEDMQKIFTGKMKMNRVSSPDLSQQQQQQQQH